MVCRYIKTPQRLIPCAGKLKYLEVKEAVVRSISKSRVRDIRLNLYDTSMNYLITLTTVFQIK